MMTKVPQAYDHCDTFIIDMTHVKILLHYLFVRDENRHTYISGPKYFLKLFSGEINL